MIQQSIAQKLTSIYKPQFSSHSHGFRPKRSAHSALRKCRDYITQGNVYTVVIDLERYFDTVNHSKLIEILSRTIKDVRVVSIIHKFGYAFYRYRGEGRLRIYPKSVEKLKARIRKMTSRSNGWGNERRKHSVNIFRAGFNI